MSRIRTNMPSRGQVRQGLSMIPPQGWLYIVGIPLALGVGYFLLYRPLAKKLNIIKTKDDELAEKTWNQIRLQPFWTSNYYKSYGGDTITSQEAVDYANRLYNAMKTDTWTKPFGLGTDEDAIFGVFGALGSKGNISKVAEAYNIVNQADLLTHLESELNSEELIEIGTKISVYAS